jgi:hypothetical protein
MEIGSSKQCSRPSANEPSHGNELMDVPPRRQKEKK